MSLPHFETVTAPLAHWAHERPDALALADETRQWTFAELQAAVRSRAAALARERAPRMAWVQDVGDTAAGLIDFLAIVASGRTAAVGDPDWPATVLAGVRAWVDAAPDDAPPPGPLTPFYVGFTSGSTGLPKGFRRHHRSWAESFRVGLQTFGDGAATRMLAPGRLSHSLFLFGMLQGLWTGAGVRVQRQFSAARALALLDQGQAQCLVAVPSQLLLMLELAARRRLAPITATRLVMISGARWMRARTPALRALFPLARIVEFYGASETSFMTWADADEHLPSAVVGQPFANVELRIQGAPAPGDDGLIYVRSPMVFLDYVGAADGSAALREPDAAGDWLSVRDMGHVDEQGRLWLAGRQQRMIVTQGKNLFPEAVEDVLAAHPAVAAASVLGVDDALRGKTVVALLRLADGAEPPSAADLADWCRARLEAFKVPRRFWRVDAWPLTASGKTDHAKLVAAVAAPDKTEKPWRTPL
ncbi:MAG: putative acyl--CoA ligase YhfT [Paracidovorax wautersii]|uniref:Putative acyl--CoA ligase YhfT n=1 Tax=Paracidovorax wautersii TaxID=1177982 RepID=A0A7V8JP81_9BURK|nr:MAG: putative acyl--CoA ligase YhfT [Paracidovorax wautersii]